MLAGKPPLSVYITKAVTQFVESWSKGNWLVAKVARHTLQLDSVQGAQPTDCGGYGSLLQKLLLIGASYIEMYAIGCRLTLGKQLG